MAGNNYTLKLDQSWNLVSFGGLYPDASTNVRAATFHHGRWWIQDISLNLLRGERGIYLKNDTNVKEVVDLSPNSLRFDYIHIQQGWNLLCIFGINNCPHCIF